jgi:hypothetical protein
MDRRRFFSSARGRRSAIALGALVVLTGAGQSSSAVAQEVLPGVRADFRWTPAVAGIGQAVTFESTSEATGIGNAIDEYRWDLDGDTDNGYETGWGSTPVITTSYNAAGTITKTVTVGQPPVASFSVSPAAPLVNEPVTFTSTASDPDGSIAELAWDLNGDGSYDNGTGPVALRSFSAPGAYVVGLRVTDNDGLISFYSQTVAVGGAPPFAAVPPVLRLQLLSPFPVVRIAGRTTRRGVRVKLLRVDAPPGSTIQVRCKGKSCPFHSSVRAANVVRVKRLERVLRAGVRVRVYVTSPTAIGKYTVFKVRRRQAPLRADACLMPGSLNPVPCPSS